jgi:hypothetical protein
MVAALTQSVSADGQTPFTGALNAGNNKITGLTAGAGTGEALAFQQLFNQGVMADIASAATTDIGVQNTNFLRVTGNTTITSFGSNYKGPRFLVFEGAVTLTNSSTLVLPGGKNITTSAGDVLILIPGATLGTADKWIVAAYQPAASVLPSAGGFGFRNRIINGNFRINQRNYVSGSATTVGLYILDRWKVTATNGITFSTASNKTTVTIPSGQTIQQIIEGLNLDTGTYVLSWEGTAQGRVNGGSYGASGAVTASVTGGTNTTIEFNAGTVTNIQFERGTIATSFECRDYGRELMMCQRYQPTLELNSTISGFATSTASAFFSCPFLVSARTTPSGVTATSIASGSLYTSSGGNVSSSSIAWVTGGINSAFIQVNCASGLVAGNGTMFFSGGGKLLFNGCEL